MEKKDRTILFDCVFGIISVILSFNFLSFFGLSIGSLLLGAMVLIIGFIRLNRTGINPFLKALYLISPYVIFLMGAMNGVYHLFFLLVIAYTGSLIGVYSRKAFQDRKILGFIPVIPYLIVIYFFAMSFLPLFFNKKNWDTRNEPSPMNFALMKPNGDTLYSKELKNKIVVLDFWATWCGPCKDEFPELIKLRDKYKNNERVVFLIVNCYERKKDIAEVKRFIARSEYDLPFMIDVNDVVVKKYDSGTIPTTYFIDHQGTIRFTHHGYAEVENFYEESCKRIDFLLNSQ